MPFCPNPVLIKLTGAGGGGGGGGTLFDRSLRLRASASARILAPGAMLSSGGTKYTISIWVHRGSVGDMTFYGGLNASSVGMLIKILSGTIFWAEYTGVGTYSGRRQTTATYTDVTAAHHYLFVFDSTQATAADRMKVYVDGTQVTSFSATTDPTLNSASVAASGGSMPSPMIGALNNNGTAATFLDGYVSGVHILDGIAASPSDFGVSSGGWVPVAYTGGYGTLGSQLLFGDATTTSTIVADTSPNARTWTGTNISVTSGVTYDSMYDVAYDAANGVYGLGTYPILYSGGGVAPTMTAAGLTSAATGTGYVISTQSFSTGIFYCEATITTFSSATYVGIAKAVSTGSSVGFETDSYSFQLSNVGRKADAVGGTALYGSPIASGDVIGILMDVSAGGTLTFYRNNVSMGTAFSGLGSGPWYFAFSNNPTIASNVSLNFGQRPFSYSIPGGGAALNTYNN